MGFTGSGLGFIGVLATRNNSNSKTTRSRFCRTFARRPCVLMSSVFQHLDFMDLQINMFNISFIFRDKRNRLYGIFVVTI